MITCNSISGGMTSAMIASKYKADYNLFALVTSNDPLVKFPDKSLRQRVSDKIGREFIGTLEDDLIIYTMLDLEQHLGSEITWVSGLSFEDVIKYKRGYLPNIMSRFCTTHMKIEPMFNFWMSNVGEPMEMRIGFRANEGGRVKNMIKRMDADGCVSFKNIETTNIQTRRNKWRETKWQKPVFPLYDDGIYKQDVINYWKGKSVRFAPLNNCVACFHRNPILLNKMSKLHPKKFDWFINQEESTNNQFKSEVSYKKIKEYNTQIEINLGDWEDDCDSGYCGL